VCNLRFFAEIKTYLKTIEKSAFTIVDLVNLIDGDNEESEKEDDDEI